MQYDYLIIGGGIVGASVAWQLGRRLPNARMLLLEKETGPARHQTGRNSGVIHAGVYYEPGSLKARFCKRGATATYAFCREHGIACEQTGKLLVATDELEVTRAKSLFGRCKQNGLNPEWITAGELMQLEPEIRGRAAIRVQESGIVDYPAICNAMLQEFRDRGGECRFGHAVTAIEENDRRVRVHAGEAFTARRLVVCGGLNADRLAQLQGLGDDFRIVPYRGEYYRLRPGAEPPIRHLIYPIPDPALPFLGIHLTRMIDGSVTIGPNALQGWKREGYGRFNFDLHDTLDMLSWPGFWKAGWKHRRHGFREAWRAWNKSSYLRQARKYCPGIEVADLAPWPAGIRAQAVLSDGSLIHDFLLRQTTRSLHVCNAPSPAATAAIPIGEHICDILLGQEAERPHPN